MPSAACTKSRTALGSAPISVCGKITPSCMAWLLWSMRCHSTRCVRRAHLYHTAPDDGSPGILHSEPYLTVLCRRVHYGTVLDGQLHEVFPHPQASCGL